MIEIPFFWVVLSEHVHYGPAKVQKDGRQSSLGLASYLAQGRAVPQTVGNPSCRYSCAIAVRHAFHSKSLRYLRIPKPPAHASDMSHILNS